MSDAATSEVVVKLGSTSNGRVSGKNWKLQKSATVRSNLPKGVKTTSWEKRRQQDTKAAAIKALEREMKEEKRAEIQKRKDIIKERREKAEEKRRLEEMKAKMSAKKLARLKRRQGRSKKVNG